jgi:hypothetical protein
MLFHAFFYRSNMAKWQVLYIRYGLQIAHTYSSSISAKVKGLVHWSKLPRTPKMRTISERSLTPVCWNLIGESKELYELPVGEMVVLPVGETVVLPRSSPIILTDSAFSDATETVKQSLKQTAGTPAGKHEYPLRETRSPVPRPAPCGGDTPREHGTPRHALPRHATEPGWV